MSVIKKVNGKDIVVPISSNLQTIINKVDVKNSPFVLGSQGSSLKAGWLR